MCHLLGDAESSASLCTSAKSNLRDRVLGEVEKNRFIALPVEGGHSFMGQESSVSSFACKAIKLFSSI